MKAILIRLLLILCCLYTSVGAIANEAHHLVRLMKSQRLQGHPQPDSRIYLNGILDTSVNISPQEELKEADRIEALPGQPKKMKLTQYAGYVTVDSKAGRALFYYFVKAHPEPFKKPLVLWLNGGPGCSSIGGGAMEELGPFFVNRDGKTLYRNRYAWNTEANMLFLESPAGVGFSYSNTTSDYQLSGDRRTAEDSYTFLINWLERFPEYKDRDFFITGESYAGHYIPELALTIMARNKVAKATPINLKGVAIGNAYFDAGMNDHGVYDYLFTHAFISEKTHADIIEHCDFKGNGTYSDSCNNDLQVATDEIGNIDYYNLYAPVCLGSSNSNASRGKTRPDDPCAPKYIFNYLNLPEVQRALHANNTGLKYLWQDCSDIVGPDNWADMPNSMLPLLKELTKSDIRVWLFSGDIDSVVPVTATQYALDSLRLPIKAPWRPWFSDDGQVAGYVVDYEGLVFATVRGAGHMVPRYQPRRALTLFTSFLNGKLPPAQD